ncbi:hypothetical protein [Candidatus Thiothrix anitrata]|uniref:Uncharacterized protein n=1 Tax=Candidatus Thiothrix anitrata TaxID=2823902 RepID=A0ABX7X3T5_9GAMM|nr:hypothetical protein [Candidatus Thiothrix anitrata]QTR50525.1 hypothetical protein J8380_02850 [Candidatus Thiothrix anitrata]
MCVTINRFLVGLLLAISSPLLLADNQLWPSFPSIPPSYQVLRPQTMVKNAKVNFPAYVVEQTNGYRVTAPDGNELIVDSITQPKCAFYGTYVNTDEDGYLGMGEIPHLSSAMFISAR